MQEDTSYIQYLNATQIVPIPRAIYFSSKAIAAGAAIGLDAGSERDQGVYCTKSSNGFPTAPNLRPRFYDELEP